MDGLEAAVLDAATDTIQARIDSIARLLDQADGPDRFRVDLLEWAGRTRMPAHAELFGDALAMADLMGRAEVIDEAVEDGQIELAEPTVGTVPFEEAIAFFRQKVSMPSGAWTDHLRQAHDRAFVVAGADDLALVEDIRGALDRAMDAGGGWDAFRKDFREIVGKTGWVVDGDLGRRARTIYETNLRSSRAAGRWAQMRDPDMMRLRPFWQYKHGHTREPMVPRDAHLELDGLVLAADDPTWDRIYPPNDFGCSCGVVTLSRAALRRLGKEGPDEPPALPTVRQRDPATDEVIDVIDGIGLGWDYAPGASWHAQVVPRELQVKPRVEQPATVPDALPDLEEIARPLSSELLPAGEPQEVYVEAFLSRFGATMGPNGGTTWRDVTGSAVAISDDLFRDKRGRLKGDKRGRGPYALRMAEAMQDPDEVWMTWKSYEDGRFKLYRTYLRLDQDASTVSILEFGRASWHGTTTFVTDQDTERGRRAYVEGERQGAMLYRRKR